MPRVIFVNRYFCPDHSATSQLLSDLCFALSSSGIDIAVVTSRYRYEASDSAPLSIAEVIGKIHVYRCRGTDFGRAQLIGRAIDYISFYFAAWLKLFLILQRGDIVVFMTDPPLLGAVLLPVAKLRGAKVVNWFQDLFPEVAESLSVKGVTGPVSTMLRSIRNASCKSAALNVAVGERMLQHLLNNGVEGAHCKVISNWVPVEIKPFARETNALRVEWGLDKYLVVGYSGNLGRAHDWQTIFRCMSALSSSEKIRFLMIGGGVGMERLREKVETEGLSNVVFKPYQPLERLGESLSVSDVHLASQHLSVSDYLVPSKVYGVMAVARPLLFIGSDESEISDLLQRYNFGWVVRPGDFERLSEKISYLLENPKKIAIMGERGRQIYDEKYSASKAHAAWQHLLAEII